jgi:flagellar biosynthesis protein FlhA
MQASATVKNIGQNLQAATRGNLVIPLMVMVLLGMMTLPVPTFLLDTFFSFNIALSIVVLLVCVYTLRPLDFAVFPTILLVATLLRLALNVASTRIVLLYGHEGGDAAGKVIEAFGKVLIGGNYAVGLVVFLILMIINFVVVTKGAGRVSEVSARFTLDAMPGKQMAIDADLNAGLIDADQAKQRRQDIASEADFYGAMDGASKFVKGDAIAGILILIINILGGLAIGMAQHNLDFSDAVEKYSLLTIGDGLVAQIPSLLLSTATAIIVTRNSSSIDVGQQVLQQMFSSARALAISAMILIVLGLIPGMPHIAFLSLGFVFAVCAFYIYWKANLKGRWPRPKAAQLVTETNAAKDIPTQPEPEVKELGWDDMEPIDRIGLEVGYRLIPLVDKAQGGQLLNRIKGVRKKLSQEMGFLIPSVHIRDNLDLNPNAYRITLMGVIIAEVEIYPDRMLAINPGQVFGNLPGIETQDPAFGLDALWIEQKNKEQAQTLGFTVVDASTVAATHLNQILQEQSYELLGHEDVQKMLDLLAKNSPKLAEELVPNKLSLGQFLGVLQRLLKEQVPLRDLRSIAEAIVNSSVPATDPVGLTNAARIGLSRQIVQSIFGNIKELTVMTLEPALEQLLQRTVQQSQQQGHASDPLLLEPNLAEKLQKALGASTQKREIQGQPAVLLVTSPIRYHLAQFIRGSVEHLSVLSYQEIPDNKAINIVEVIGNVLNSTAPGTD